MLPGLRLIFGGFCAALIGLMTGLGLVATSRSYVTPAGAALPARGALIEHANHPEWKQFLVHAALRRADELNRLSELPGRVPGRNGGAYLANMPTRNLDFAPDDETGSVTRTPGVTIPIDIGVTSSTELSVPGLQPPQVKPERAKPPVASEGKSSRKIRPRAAKPASTATPSLLGNPFSALFRDSSK